MSKDYCVYIESWKILDWLLNELCNLVIFLKDIDFFIFFLIIFMKNEFIVVVKVLFMNLDDVFGL